MDTFDIEIDLGLRKEDCSIVFIEEIYTKDVGFFSTCIGVDAYLEDSNELIREPKLLTLIVDHINTYEEEAMFTAAHARFGS